MAKSKQKPAATRDNYSEFSEDVSAHEELEFFDSTESEAWGPFTPLEVVALDPKQRGTTKASVLIKGKLAKPDGSVVSAGVWYKPGLSALLGCGGIPTVIQFSGEKDVGQALPMKLFAVRVKKGQQGAKLQLTHDYRSKRYELPRALVAPQPLGPERTGESDDDYDDAPF